MYHYSNHKYNHKEILEIRQWLGLKKKIVWFSLIIATIIKCLDFIPNEKYQNQEIIQMLSDQPLQNIWIEIKEH